MDLKFQKRLAARTLGIGMDRLSFDTSRYEDIKEAITKADIRSLARQGAINITPFRTPSRLRAKARRAQQKKGRQRGPGKKHGAKFARMPRKLAWMNKIRALRQTLSELRSKKQIDNKTYYDLYAKAKGGFFRDRSHLQFYLESNKLVIKKP